MEQDVEQWQEEAEGHSVKSAHLQRLAATRRALEENRQLSRRLSDLLDQGMR